ncbi:MAG TPA: response regulator [Nakamurella sp.]|nr:response regulator [Nakamurella sp.]
MSIGASGNGQRATATVPASPPADRPPVPTVLIVDDDPDQLGLLTAYFYRAGCSVIGLADAEQALALPHDVELDLMVLDLRLPGMDGWELTGRLRSRYPRCPIAITSVLDVEEYPDADGALPKPVSKAHIHRLLASTIRRWEL